MIKLSLVRNIKNCVKVIILIDAFKRFVMAREILWKSSAKSNFQN